MRGSERKSDLKGACRKLGCVDKVREAGDWDTSSPVKMLSQGPRHEWIKALIREGAVGMEREMGWREGGCGESLRGVSGSNAHGWLSWEREQLPTAGSQVAPATTTNTVLLLISVNDRSLMSRLVWLFQGLARRKMPRRKP